MSKNKKIRKSEKIQKNNDCVTAKMLNMSSQSFIFKCINVTFIFELIIVIIKRLVPVLDSDW